MRCTPAIFCPHDSWQERCQHRQPLRRRLGQNSFHHCSGELFKARNIKFDVLSRGYGRKTKGVLEVNPSGSAQDSEMNRYSSLVG